MKNLVKQIAYSCVLVLFLGCSTTRMQNSKNTIGGYNTAEELYKASLIAIKSKDKIQIADFVVKSLPDENTAKYMRKTNCRYRGFPYYEHNIQGDLFEAERKRIDSLIVFTTQEYYDFSLSLERRYGSLENLQFVGFDRDASLAESFESDGECKGVLGMEPWGRFTFPNSNDTIEYKIGEILKVNGKWKSFTYPKFF